MKTTDTERCINFSERFGMSTIIADARAELAAMQERNAKLEAALKTMLTIFDREGTAPRKSGVSFGSHVCDEARAILAEKE